MIAQIREFITKESDDKVGELVESIANHIQITAVRETFERLAGESKKVLMQIIEAEWICPTNCAFNDTNWWVTVWSAMYAAWATKNGHNPPWYPEFTANKPVHQAMSDHSLKATVSVTKLALKPGVSTPTFCRFTTDDDDDQSSNNRNRSPSRTPPARRPAPNPLASLPDRWPATDGPLPRARQFFQYNLPHAQRSDPNPKNLHPKNPSMSAGSHKRPPPPTHQTDPYA